MSKTKFKPLHDHVLVRRIEQEAKTAGGIIIPDTAQEKPMEGEVVAIGSGARAEDGTVTPLDVKPGDRILFGKWSGSEVKIDGEEMMIMKESDILGIIEGRREGKAVSKKKIVVKTVSKKKAA
ncbi:MAG: co-chaperone GroES [Rhodospirillales bacterium]|nr:co-chaperone GroES [Rhodospirillales bacterium]